jgi:hypothetical protein
MADTEAMQQSTAQVATELSAGLAYAQGLEIRNDKDMERAQEDLKDLKRRIKVVQSAKDRFTDPAKAIIEAAKAVFDPQIETGKQIEAIVKAKCVAFRNMVTQRKAALQMQAQAAIAAHAPVPEQRLAIAAVNAMSAPKTAAVCYIDQPYTEVTDPAQLPERYWIITRSINADLIDEDIAKGIEVPGTTRKVRTVMRVGT